MFYLLSRHCFFGSNLPVNDNDKMHKRGEQKMHDFGNMDVNMLHSILLGDSRQKECKKWKETIGWRSATTARKA